jgi:hypothetical protein
MPEGIIKPTNADKAWIAADPVAALVGYGSTILAVFGVFDALGLDADQVAILGGAVLGVMGSVRALRERKQRKEVLELHQRHEAVSRQLENLQRETGSLTDGEVPVSEGPGGSVTAGEAPGGPEGPEAA